MSWFHVVNILHTWFVVVILSVEEYGGFAGPSFKELCCGGRRNVPCSLFLVLRQEFYIIAQLALIC